MSQLSKISLAGFSPVVCDLCAAASRAAYDDEAALAQLSREYGATTFHFLSDRETDTECFAAERGNVILLSFRGSQTSKDFFTDGRFHRANYNHAGTVHRGFLGAYRSLRLKLMEAFVKQRETHSFYVTGHSLGGALAVLAALDLHETGFNIAGVYTFGQPRVGDKKFARFYDDRLGAQTFRLVNGEDVITRLPGVLAGYRHCGQEIFLDSFGDVRVNPPWYAKLPSDFWGFAKEIDVVLPPVTALNAIKDHAMAAYLTRIQS